MSAGLEVRARVDFRAVGRAAFRLEVDTAFPCGVTAVLGPSGSGKSTLLGVVAGRFRRAAARVALDDRVLQDDATRVWLPPARRRLGYALQTPLLFPHLTALENVCYGVHRWTAGRRERWAFEWLERVGAADLAARHPTTLSGGEQRRVALARALATEARVVLLDEPTAALDLGARAAILEVVRRAQSDTGVPFLYVCHSPSEAVRVADHAVVLDDGKIAQQGTPLEVLSSPRSLAAARTGGFENVLPVRVLEHQPKDGITRIESQGVELEMSHYPVPIGSELDVALRAEDIIVALEPVRGTSARNVIGGTVRRIHHGAGHAELEVHTPAPLLISVTSVTVHALSLQEGSQVYLLIKARAIHPLE